MDIDFYTPPLDISLPAEWGIPADEAEELAQDAWNEVLAGQADVDELCEDFDFESFDATLRPGDAEGYFARLVAARKEQQLIEQSIFRNECGEFQPSQTAY